MVSSWFLVARTPSGSWRVLVQHKTLAKQCTMCGVPFAGIRLLVDCFFPALSVWAPVSSCCLHPLQPGLPWNSIGLPIDAHFRL